MAEPFRPDYSDNRFRVDPIYVRMTTPRLTNDSRSALPSVQDLFGELSQTSQFKVSLFLGDTYPTGDSDTDINAWLVTCGVLGSSLFNGNNANLNSLRYEFMCNKTTLPGSNIGVLEEFGSRQGISEKFANRRDYSEMSMDFYVDAEYGVLRLFEEWLNFINPLYKRVGGRDQFGNPRGGVDHLDDTEILRFRYPEQYKRDIAITKFERDTFVNSAGDVTKTPSMITYKFINAFPTQLTAVPVDYSGSTITKTNVNFVYDRYVILNHQGQESDEFGQTFNEQFNNNGGQIPLLAVPQVSYTQSDSSSPLSGTNPSLALQ